MAPGRDRREACGKGRAGPTSPIHAVADPCSKLGPGAALPGRAHGRLATGSGPDGLGVSRMRILLVEDHEEIWDFLSRRLRRRGFDVVLATDGQQGVEKAKSDAPDIVLLDMNLPVLDGWTAATMIKADPDTARVPIIALTAHAMSGDREKAIAAGCDDYHPKPVDFSRLLTQIETLTGASPAPA